MCEDRTQNCEPERHPSKHRILETNRVRAAAANFCPHADMQPAVCLLKCIPQVNGPISPNSRYGLGLLGLSLGLATSLNSACNTINVNSAIDQ